MAPSRRKRSLSALLLAAALLALSTTPATGRALLQQQQQGAPAAPTASPSPAKAAAAPAPAFFFPLTARALMSSVPARGYQAVASAGVEWRSDPQFGEVVDCSQARGSYLTLPGVTYGSRGTFTVAVWAKPRLTPGTSLDYVFSHNGTVPGTGAPGASDQVQLYLPEADHRDRGVVRAIVRGGGDAPGAAAEPTFLDSDGCVSNPGCPAAQPAPPVDDGAWHFLAVTTHPQGGKGFELFVDGRREGSVDEGQLYRDAAGNTFPVTGGGPMALGGVPTLCARADLEPTRMYTGSLANLRIFDSALTAAQIKALYDADAAAFPRAALAAAPATGGAAAADPRCAVGSACTLYNGIYMCTNPGGQLVRCGQSAPQGAAAGGSPGAGVAADGSPCATPCLDYNGVASCQIATGQVRACTNATLGDSPFARAAPVPEPRAAADPAAAATAMRINGQPLCSAAPISGLPTVTACGAGFACAPLSAAQLRAALGAAAAAAAPAGQVGVCAYAPAGLALPAPSVVPPAMAFFPLNAPALGSFPLGELKAINDGATIVADPVFGGALRCRSNDSDVVALDPVPYGAATGAFAINLWARPGANQSGASYSYLVSHRGTEADATGWGPNQVALYMPQGGTPAYGVMRAYVRDSDDAYSGPESEGYVDSDGRVASNDPRPGPSTLLDSSWHMFTVTSQPGGGPGYLLYADGKLAAQVNATAPGTARDGSPLHVDGGGPLQLGGNVVLCSRYDADTERHYDGELAYLSLWDQALTPSQVAALYAAVQQKAAAAPAAAAPAGAPRAEQAAVSTRQVGPSPTRFTRSGRLCRFPALFNGQMVNDCVPMGGGAQLYCSVGDAAWEACADNLTAAFPLAALAVPPAAERSSSSGADASPFSSSVAAGNSTRAPLHSASGRLCQLPLSYHGLPVDNCVSIGQGHYCWPQGGAAWAACSSAALRRGPDPGDLGVGPSAVAILVVPQRTRITVDGDACQLPTVDRGQILDDCAQRGGQWACPTSAGPWKACDLRGAAPPAAPKGPLVVAQRTSASGAKCLLPAVVSGLLWFNCAKFSPSSAEGVRDVCPTADATWQVCAPMRANATTKALSLRSAVARTAPGDTGQLCQVAPAKSAPAAAGCAANLTCVPLPPLTNSSAVKDPLAGGGFCAPRPGGAAVGVFPALARARAPQPLAYFPLTGGSLSSLTLPNYRGQAIGEPAVRWGADQAARSALVLENVPYAANGSFAVNLWMRRLPGSNTSGDAFGYLFSHTGIAEASTVSPNQVAVYVPESGHPAYGGVRAYVKDANDQGDLAYLDSDGQLNNNANRTKAGRKAPSVNDGAWHMVTLSTLPSLDLGFALYLDGSLVGQLGLSNGSLAAPSGGDPALMRDDITLCARSDLDPTDPRYFDGAVAHVALFGAPLAASQVAALYAAYANATPPAANASAAASGALAAPAPPPPASTGDGGGSNAGLITGVVFASIGAAAAVAALLALAVSAARNRGRARRFDRFNDDPFAAAAAATGGAFPAGGGPAAAVAAPYGGASIQLSSGASGNLKPADAPAAGRPHSQLSAVSSQAPGGTPPGGSPARAAAAAAAGGGPPEYASRLIPSAGPGSVASHATTLTDEVEIEPGKRGLFKNKEARVVVPDDLGP